MNDKILLENATRDELMNELCKRKSITNIKINQDNGANIKTISGNVYVSGEAYIFVIKPCEGANQVKVAPHVVTGQLKTSML